MDPRYAVGLAILVVAVFITVVDLLLWWRYGVRWTISGTFRGLGRRSILFVALVAFALGNLNGHFFLCPRCPPPHEVSSPKPSAAATLSEASQDMTNVMHMAQMLAEARAMERADRKLRYLTLGGYDEQGQLRMTNGKRFYWMTIDPNWHWWSPAFPQKKGIILTQWYTWGKEAQMMRSDKFEAAWKAGHPGIWKMRYDERQLKEIFGEDCVFEY